MKKFIPMLKQLPADVDRILLMFGLDLMFEATFDGLVTLNAKLSEIQLTDAGKELLLKHERGSYVDAF